ncbi:ABC transporter ATP-binding protein [Bombiscardovia nodaiensis]|uniref:ABC transporter ATP-binding protein n=1 Tax=Bombiscardovia nodaiensis TaxID=2932181 RepID=A0ABM8B6N8_9BIFI|nr:ABC transporter ATP-binding protein [Bombiscardovia nodaiensis]
MLELSDLSFTYAGSREPAVNQVSCRLEPGQVLVITGKSGCGKTTISRLINGLIPELYEGRKDGSCRVAGLETGSVPIFQVSERIGSVFQNPKTQFFTTDVTSELAFPLENMGIDRQQIRERLHQVADLFGIGSLLDRSMFALSGGEKQLVALASSYMLDPQLLLLDEPSSNLDTEAIETLMRVLVKLKGLGMSMVIIEHRLYYLRQLADRFLVVDRGAVTHDLSPEQMADMSQQTREELGLRALSLPAPGEQEIRPGASVSVVAPVATVLGSDTSVAAESSLDLHIEGLTYSYKGGELPALRVDSLNLNNREVVGIVGRNGAGKSTLAKALTGLIKVDKGARISLAGRRMSARGLTRESFLVFQDVNYQLFSESVAKELVLGAPDQGRERLQEVAQQLGLADLLERNPSTLSGGQKQRLAVGCAVLSGKRLVIMDEPTSGLDLAHMHQVTHAIDFLHSLGAIVLVISHDREFLQQTCTRFIRFEQGRVISDSHQLG